MRSYLYRPVAFVGLLLLCLAFAPARWVTGDRTVYPQPAVAKAVASDKPFDELCKTDPVAAVAQSLAAYKKDVEEYSCTFVKRERIDGKLRDKEVIACDFRESPFSVRMRWKEGQGRAIAMMYPAGDRADMVAAVPANPSLRKLAPVANKRLTDPTVMEASRSPVTEFGLGKASQRALTDWQRSKDAGTLKVRYRGLEAVPELDGKKCYVLVRDCPTPETDGLTRITLMFDPETLLQVGSVLHAGDELIAQYFYRDLKLNPKLAADHFTVSKLKESK